MDHILVTSGESTTEVLRTFKSPAELYAERYAEKGGDYNEGLQIGQRMQQAGTLKAERPSVPLIGENTTPPVQQKQLFEDQPAPGAMPDIDLELGISGKKPTPVKRPTRRQIDFLELALSGEETREKNDVGYLATAMIYASLPHSELTGPVYKRQNGPMSLTILVDPDIGLPFGKIPRLLTAYLCTEAKKTGNPEISLGSSQTELMHKLGMRATGGENGTINRLKDQAKRLFSSSISLTSQRNEEFNYQNMQISSNGMLLWDPKNPNNESQWESAVRLSESFFESCINHSVPFDMRVMQSLRSPLAMDIYMWLTYRYNSVTAPTPITWQQLRWQFGANYADTEQGLADFKKNFLAQVKTIKKLYPDANFKVETKLFTLMPSKPHIPPQLKR